VICSLTLLTNKKIFWFAGMIIGAVGAAASLAGFWSAEVVRHRLYAFAGGWLPRNFTTSAINASILCISTW